MTLEQLFQKFLDETITPEELRQLREAAGQDANRTELERLLAKWMDADFPAAHPEELDVEALYSALTQSHDIPAVELPADETPARLSPIPFYKRISARTIAVSAAAVSIVAVAGLFLFRKQAVITPPTTPAIARQAPIAPAGDKAVLTLANGQQIILANAAAGNLASQGGTQVIKLDNGQLAYQAGKSNMSGNDTTTLYNELATPRGGFYQLVLPDGSNVWLDAASSLRFPTAFKGKERTVELRGEAYFEIAPNAAQPFKVTTHGVKVDVLGTAFNVMAYEDEDAIRTTLVSGAIQVSKGTASRQAKPGQQVSWAFGSNALQMSTPDMQQVLAWKQGEFRFEGLSMDAIMRQIARWYDVDIILKGPQPKTEFNGVIPRKKNVEELLTVLEETGAVHFILEHRKITVEASESAQ